MPESKKRGPRLDARELVQLSQIMSGFCGIKLDLDAREAVERRLGDRVESLGCDAFAGYLAELRHSERGHAELERAAELVATHETYFFREQSQLRAFADVILPEIAGRARQRGSITVWSAGCSTGEEAYTIAILAEQNPALAGMTAHVFGTDLSRKAILTARKGRYGASSFRALPFEQQRWFVAAGGERVVAPEIRARCHFRQLNLLDDSRIVMAGHVDAIFCRNVLIYFDEPARVQVLATFFERLHPGGYLLLGHSESLIAADSAFESVQVEGELVYRKPLSRAPRRSP